MKRIIGILALFGALLTGIGMVSGSFALTTGTIDRPHSLTTALDTTGGAASQLTGFDNTYYSNLTIGGNYTEVGSIRNNLGSSAQISLSITPAVTAACKPKNKNDLTCGQNQAFTLYYCWATDQTSAAGTTCSAGAGGSASQLTALTGTGPTTWTVQTAPGLTAAPGGSLYLFVRVASTGGTERVCGNASFTVAVTPSGGNVKPYQLIHSASSPRMHYYRFGSGCP